MKKIIIHIDSPIELDMSILKEEYSKFFYDLYDIFIDYQDIRCNINQLMSDYYQINHSLPVYSNEFSIIGQMSLDDIETYYKTRSSESNEIKFNRELLDNIKVKINTNVDLLNDKFLRLKDVIENTDNDIFTKGFSPLYLRENDNLTFFYINPNNSYSIIYDGEDLENLIMNVYNDLTIKYSYKTYPTKEYIVIGKSRFNNGFPIGHTVYSFYHDDDKIKVTDDLKNKDVSWFSYSHDSLKEK